MAGAALLLGSAGFAVGRAYTSHRTDLVSATGQQVPAVPGGEGLPGNRDGGRDGDGGFGHHFDSATTAIGQVASISGSSLTMRSPRGTLTVKTTSTTTVNGTSGGKLSALSVGQIVLARGTLNSDGTFTATALYTRGVLPGGDDADRGAGRSGTSQGGTSQGGTTTGTTGATT